MTGATTRFRAARTGVVLAIMALVAGILFVSGSAGAGETPGLCHWDDTSESYQLIFPASPGQLNGHLDNHPNDIYPAPADGCPDEQSTSTTTSSTTTSSTTTTSTTTTSTTTTTTLPQEVEKDCPDEEFCYSGPVQNDTTQGKLRGFDATSLYIGVFPEEEQALSCGDYPLLSNTVVFDVFHDDEGEEKIIKVTLLGVGGPKSQYRACYGGTEPFTQKNGKPAVQQGELWVGFLPKCVTDMGETVNPAPCIRNRRLFKNGDVRLVVVAPPGDPRVRIG